MPQLYEVKINRLRLPRGPLAEGYPDPDITISVKPDTYPSEADALKRARILVQKGCGVSIVLPDGREWAHEEVLRRLNNTGS
jgi:hypothetical protein